MSPARGVLPVAEAIQRREGRAMASPLSLALVGPSGHDDAIDSAWTVVVDEFAATDRALSRFRADSEVSVLNRAALRGEGRPVGWRLALAAHACDRAHRLSGGRFDPRILDLLDEWGYHGADLGAAGGTTALGAAGPLVERLDEHRIRLPAPIDLGGIGKGLAVRWAADRLRRAGVSRFLIDAGGDIATDGPGPDGDPWRIGIEDPMGRSEPLAVIAITGGAVATSSVRRLHWTRDGVARHHLVDPATRAPADGGLLAVTVAQADPAWAEVWAKVLFIAGRAKIADEARGRGWAAWWVASDGSLEMTPAARQQTMWVRGEG